MILQENHQQQLSGNKFYKKERQVLNLSFHFQRSEVGRMSADCVSLQRVQRNDRGHFRGNTH